LEEWQRERAAIQRERLGLGVRVDDDTGISDEDFLRELENMPPTPKQYFEPKLDWREFGF
jgi:hypothetical protein